MEHCYYYQTVFSMEKNRIRTLILLLSLLATFNRSYANNIQVSGITLTGQNTVSDYTHINFSIAWDNSWRTPIGPQNWDAAWIFAKYRINTQSVWQHATLHYVDGTGTGDGHTVPPGAIIRGSNDNGLGGSHGVFLYGDANYLQSNVNYANVRLRWDYGVDGLSDQDSVEICVFGIEMVYVPENSFYVGSGGSEYGAFYLFPTATSPVPINSEAAINVGANPGDMFYDNPTFCGDMTGPIPAEFPKGYSAFYSMKYEITQQQYVDFLNKITTPQTVNREFTFLASRNFIAGGPGAYSTTTPYLPCNYLSWGDLTAYLDWVGLRPMTELEFEKACRGTDIPLANEYVWGSNLIASNLYSLSAPGTNTEQISSNYDVVAGNACYAFTDAAIDGPLRSGIFAHHVLNTGRISSGATYYGIMEMAGNLWEQVVSLGASEGRAFTGRNGDGELDAAGDHNVVSWPLGTNGYGSGLRGGYYGVEDWYLRTSDRFYAAYVDNARWFYNGGRGVRIAP